MRITDIHVDGFGVWNELSVDDLADGVTLFFGRNEAGKTTLMQFVRAVLYGFSAERRKLYVPPVYDGIPGGMLRVENHSGQFVVERRLSERHDQSPGRVIVLAANGSRQGQHLLNVLLSGVDESIFNNVFAVGIRELQELATLNDTQAAELLYTLASGVDRVSLVDVMRELETSRQRILPSDQQPSTISQLLDQREQLAKEIAALTRQTRHWSDLGAERTSLVDEVAHLEKKILQLEREARTVEIAIQVRDKWFRRHDVQRQLDECGHVEELPEGCVEHLDEINSQIQQQKELLKPLRHRRLELRRELAAQPINRALWDESSRIQAICEHGPWIESLDGEIRELHQELEASELELLQHEEKLAAEGGAALANSPPISPRAVQQLQPTALTLRESVKKRSIVHKQQKKSRQDEEQAVSELQSELAGRNAENLEEALEHAGELVNQLRRRVKVEERLEQMWRQQEELEQEHHELLDNQLQRVRLLVGIGGMWVFGFVLLLTGLFGWKVMPMSAEISWGIGLLGLVCVGMSSAWKIVLERTTQDELHTCARRRESLDREVELAFEERVELDRELPAGSGNFTTRLASAQKELKELEAMAPLYRERVEAKRRIHEARRQSSGVDDELREARNRWRRALRQAGLPETLTPKHIRQLGAHSQKKEKFEQRVGRQRERLGKLQADREALVDRLRQLHKDIGINPLSEDPQIQLSQLATALSGQKEMVQRRRELQSQEKEIRREVATHLQQLRRLLRTREALFAEARVADEQQLRERVQRLERSEELVERRLTLSDEIATIMGDHCSQEEIEQQLVDSPENLQRRWEDLIARLQECQSHLGQLHQRRGEINQEMKALAKNQRLVAARFELGCVEQQLVKATSRWRLLTTTWHLLESVRETYEAERQPETLGEASLYLERLTGGKYTRVWTPLGRNELRIDDGQGHDLPLDVLSRGTREAVFLSLRLALVASYARRGVSIPLVLDDVLVNLDAQRTQAAVEALCDFAHEGRQLLFFTCHDHIRAMFEQARVDIRVLPRHGTPGARVAPLELADEGHIEEHTEEEIVAEEEALEEETLDEELLEEEVDEGEEQDAYDEEDEEEYEAECEEELEEESEEEVELEFEEDPELEFEEVVVEYEEDEEDSPPAIQEEYDVEPAEPYDEDYVLQEAVERTAMVAPLDLAQFYHPADDSPVVTIEAETDDVIEPEPRPSAKADDAAQEPEYAEQIDHAFADSSEQEHPQEGRWWDTSPGIWIEEEETAA